MVEVTEDLLTKIGVLDVLQETAGELFPELSCDTWSPSPGSLQAQVRLTTRKPGLFMTVEFDLGEFGGMDAEEVVDFIESRILDVVLAAFNGRLERA